MYKSLETLEKSVAIGVCGKINCSLCLKMEEYGRI